MFFIDDIFKNIPYSYYYNDTCSDNLIKALEMERKHQLNCSDFKEDLSVEASNQRILNNMKKLEENSVMNTLMDTYAKEYYTKLDNAIDEFIKQIASTFNISYDDAKEFALRFYEMSIRTEYDNSSQNVRVYVDFNFVPYE